MNTKKSRGSRIAYERFNRKRRLRRTRKGAGNNSRSNARTLDWNGNEELAGSITLGKGTEDETTITAAQLKALLALL